MNNDNIPSRKAEMPPLLAHPEPPQAVAGLPPLPTAVGAVCGTEGWEETFTADQLRAYALAAQKLAVPPTIAQINPTERDEWPEDEDYALGHLAGSLFGLMPSEEIGHCVGLIRAALESRAPVPADWVMVPREPTEEMWTAGRDPVMHRDLNHKPALFPSDKGECPAWQINPKTGKPELDTSKGTTAVHVWRAMIAAAPTLKGEQDA